MVFWFSLCLLMTYPVLNNNKGNKLGTQSGMILGKDSANERWRFIEMSSSLAEPLPRTRGYPTKKALSAMRKHGGRALLAGYPRTIPAQFFGIHCAYIPSCPHEICHSILQHGKLFTTLFLVNMAIWCHIHYLSCAPHDIQWRPWRSCWWQYTQQSQIGVTSQEIQKAKGNTVIQKNKLLMALWGVIFL